MDLSTTYLGFKLPNPLMPGASPLVDDLDTVKRLEDAGAAAIIMHSLFEEQITQEQLGHLYTVEMHEESFAEALSYFPRPEEYRLGPDSYLEQIRKIKAMVKVPVIASLNGTSPAGWLDYAKLIEQAGADALELNVYYLATQAWETSEGVERRTLEAVRVVKGAVKIPVAVKLSPFYSALANLAKQLDEGGADALVLFNRFYQPDIDVDELEVVPSLQLSDSSELLLRLRWLARRGQGGHGGRSRGAARLRPAQARARVPADGARGDGTLDGGARVFLSLADAREHEPPEVAQPAGAGARQLHAHPAGVATVKTGDRGDRSPGKATPVFAEYSLAWTEWKGRAAWPASYWPVCSSVCFPSLFFLSPVPCPPSPVC